MADGRCSKKPEVAGRKEMTVLEAKEIVEACFQRNAKVEGDTETMNKYELSELLKNQFDIVSKNIHNVVFPESCEYFIKNISFLSCCFRLKTVPLARFSRGWTEWIKMQ